MTEEDFLQSQMPIPDTLLEAIVDSSNDAIISKDLNGTIKTWNRAAERLFGYKADEIIGKSIYVIIPEELRSQEEEILERLRKGERIENFETIRRRKDGTNIQLSITISPILNSQGQMIGSSKVARDITASKDSEQRIRALLREVNHRVKNQFAVILSIIRETSNNLTDPMEFQSMVRSRIMALARSHDLLVSSEWSGADLRELILQNLQPFGHEPQVAASGPKIILQPNAVQNLGMAFHELGANSAQHGALADLQGHVAISWNILHESDEPARFELTWEETASEKFYEPPEQDRRGFGTTILERVAPQALGGSSTLIRDGLVTRWRLVVPLVNVELPQHEIYTDRNAVN